MWKMLKYQGRTEYCYPSSGREAENVRDTTDVAKARIGGRDDRSLDKGRRSYIGEIIEMA